MPRIRILIQYHRVTLTVLRTVVLHFELRASSASVTQYVLLDVCTVPCAMFLSYRRLRREILRFAVKARRSMFWTVVFCPMLE